MGRPGSTRNVAERLIGIVSRCPESGIAPQACRGWRLTGRWREALEEAAAARAVLRGTTVGADISDVEKHHPLGSL